MMMATILQKMSGGAGVSCVGGRVAGHSPPAGDCIANLTAQPSTLSA